MVKLVKYFHTRPHLGFSAKLRMWQAPACKMEPQSDYIFCKPVQYYYNLCPQLSLFFQCCAVSPTQLALACGVPAFGRSTVGNDVVATIFIRLIFSFFSVFFSPSRPFLIEGVLGSKNLFCKSCLECPTT